jgi:hypothetical protein
VVTAHQQNGKLQGNNRSGTFRTNAHVIMVTLQQQNGKFLGMNRSETSHTNATVICEYGGTAKKENFQE